MIYSAMTYLGSNRFSALYGQNDTIVDQKATGLQHLFVDTYEKDLVYTACTAVKVDGSVYFADRIKPTVGHAKRHASDNSRVENHCILVDEFNYDSFSKIDYVAAHEDYIRFKSVIKNLTKKPKTFEFSALVITTPTTHARCQIEHHWMRFEIEGKHIGVFANETDKARLSLDAPSGFMYHGVEDILFDKNSYLDHDATSEFPMAGSLSFSKTIEPQESYTYEWILYIGRSESDLIDAKNHFVFVKDYQEIIAYWDEYLSRVGTPVLFDDDILTKLVALKGALLDGLLPADLTGHYFADGGVSFYTRDALMGSRAFLYAGLYEDFESIIRFLMACETKENGEYYQRYNVNKTGNEGANNNVFTQIDFLGYFTRVITDYFHLTQKMLCSFSLLDRMIDILSKTQKKHGLYGPEGGVNEGVYGPAFIVSTNMFIAAGLKGVIHLADRFNQTALKVKWENIYKDLFASIEQTFSELGYYPYGYVTYHDEVIQRYDTPQLLSGSLGYPLTENYVTSYQTLLEKASYFGFGIGYSEQEYHDGPWAFNTAAAAEVAFLIGDMDHYRLLLEWLKNHQNGYLMNPEAIDAKDENHPFINPLMWANSEFVCAGFANTIKKLREKS